MKLGKEFLIVNNINLPGTTSFSFSLHPIEKVNTSEAGTEIVSVTRIDKHEFSASWQVSSFWLDIFEGFCKENIVKLLFRGSEYTCRVRDFAPTLHQGSENCSHTEGLWTISLKFIEI